MTKKAPTKVRVYNRHFFPSPHKLKHSLRRGNQWGIQAVRHHCWSLLTFQKNRRFTVEYFPQTLMLITVIMNVSEGKDLATTPDLEWAVMTVVPDFILSCYSIAASCRTGSSTKSSFWPAWIDFFGQFRPDKLRRTAQLSGNSPWVLNFTLHVNMKILNRAVLYFCMFLSSHGGRGLHGSTWTLGLEIWESYHIRSLASPQAN